MHMQEIRIRIMAI